MKKIIIVLIMMAQVLCSSTIVTYAEKSKPFDIRDTVIFSESAENNLEMNVGQLDVNGYIFTNSHAIGNVVSKKLIKNSSDPIYLCNFSQKFMSTNNYNTIVHKNTFKYDESMYEQHVKIFAYDKVQINSEEVSINNILCANNAIEINTNIVNNINNDKNNIIFSSNGDIVINAKSMNFEGIIYAPSGKVIINADSILLIGSIIADQVIINSDSLDLTSNPNLLSTYEMDTYLLEPTNIGEVEDFDTIGIFPFSSGGGNNNNGEGSKKYYYNTGVTAPSKINYSKYKIKDRLKVGDVITEQAGGFYLTGHTSIVEGLFYDTKTYNNTGYSYTVTTGYIRVIEAIDKGVCRGVFDDTRADERKASVSRYMKLTPLQSKKLIFFVENQIGKPYSIDSIALPSSSVTSPNWFCSELVWAAYKHINVQINYKTNKVLPRDLGRNLNTISYK